MTTDNMASRKGDTGREHVPADDFFEDEVSIWPTVRALWSYRTVVLVGVVGIFFIFLLWAFTSYLTQPVERHASVGFRLEFAGAADGMYPNGMFFSPADIIGAPILTEVYANHELERYSSVESFENKIFVLETNDELNLLGIEYQAKFSEEGVTPADRARLEAEFDGKRVAQRQAAYALSFLGPDGTISIPDPLLNKVLNAVLLEWASQAVERRGVLSYQGGVLAQSLLEDQATEGPRDDYFTQVDLLRGKVRRLIVSLDIMEQLPGAAFIRAKDNNLSLVDIRLRLEDLLTYEIEPLSAYIIANRLTGDWESTVTYLENRRFRVNLDRTVADSKVRALEGSLRGFDSTTRSHLNQYSARDSQLDSPNVPETNVGTTVMDSYRGMFGDRFLDKLIQMVQDQTLVDAGFKRQVTNNIVTAREELAQIEREVSFYSRSMGQEQMFLGAFGTEQMRQVETRYQRSYATAVQALEDSSAIFEELSTQNLGPRTHLFRITSPFFSRTVRSITPQTILPIGMFTLLFAFVAVSLCCVIHYYFQRDRLA